jgi:hypothetical protein
MKKVLLIILIFTVCLLIACQPTPDKSPVVGKNDGKFEEKILQTQGASQSFTYPDNWKQDFQNDEGKVTIQIDAELEVPDVSAYPVVNAAPASFTNDDIKRMVDYFFAGKPAYDETGEHIKSELDKFILQDKADLVTLEQSGKVHYTAKVFTPEEIPDERNMILEMIKQKEGFYSSVPDNVERNPSKVELIKRNDVYKTCSVVDTPSGEYSLIFQASMSSDKTEDSILFFKYYCSSYDEFSDISNGPAEGMNMSLEDAENMAKKICADIGMGEVMITGKYIANYVGLDEEFIGIDNSPQCYVFYFCKPIEGIPVTYFFDYEGTAAFGPDGDPSYVYPWAAEEIEVMVNNNGIVSFQWDNPSTISDTVNQNVAILPWEDIKERAVQQFRIKNIGQYISGADQEKLSVKIDNITLGMMHIAKKDNQNEFMYIPVWDFFGKHIYGSDSYSLSERAYSILTVNAIDGSIIDRGLGY